MGLSVKDAARLLEVSEKTIYRWLKNGVIPVYKVHERYRFNRAELLEWATSNRLGMASDAYHEPEFAADPLPTLTQALEAGGIFYRIEGKTRESALADAVAHLRLSDEVDRDYLLQVLVGREQLAPTAVGEGIAIPHPRNPGLFPFTQTKVAICFLEEAVEFDALDGRPVKVLLLLTAASLRDHLHLLSRIGFVLHDPELRRALDEAESREKIFAALGAAEAKIVA